MLATLAAFCQGDGMHATCPLRLYLTPTKRTHRPSICMFRFCQLKGVFNWVHFCRGSGLFGSDGLVARSCFESIV